MRSTSWRIAPALALLTACVAVAAPAPAAEEPSLAVVGRSDLGNTGMNTDVAVVGTTAIVGAGMVAHTGYHTERYNPGPCFTATVKVVDLRDPRNPQLRSTIPLPQGVAAIEVDALRVTTPSFTGDLAAIALDDGPSQAGPTGCTPNAANPGPTFVDRGVLYYDVTDPAAPRMLGRYMADQGPTDDVSTESLPCAPPPAGSAVRCVTGQHSVSLAQRADGKVLSISVEPVADFLTKPSGDVRVVDVTDPTRPLQIGAWPPLGSRPGSFSPNGCAPFTNSHSAEFYGGGRRALVAFMDGGVFDLEIPDNGVPVQAGHFAYPNDRAVEGNAGFATAVRVGDRTLALVSDEDWHSPATTLRITSPATLAGEKFACEGQPTLFDPSDSQAIYRRPGAKVAGEIVYAGRGCPVRGTTPADPYPADVRGKIVFLDTAPVPATQPGLPTQGCRNDLKIRLAQDNGAVAVLMGRVPLAPFSASPQAIAWGGTATGLTIPGTMIDTPDADALRTALCPSLQDGACARGQVVAAELVDGPGAWGALRILDLDAPTDPTQLAELRSPTASVFPPPDAGVYAPGRAVTAGDLAYVAWHADGLRVIDLGDETPREVAKFVPDDRPDPSNTFPAKADVVGVALLAAHVLVLDTNSGLYVLERPTEERGSSVLPIVLAVVGGVVVVAGAALLIGRSRREAER